MIDAWDYILKYVLGGLEVLAIAFISSKVFVFVVLNDLKLIVNSKKESADAKEEEKRSQ